jgi:hypothetical protein
MAAFADEIGNDPVLFSLLEVFDGKPDYLRPLDATTKQNREWPEGFFDQHRRNMARLVRPRAS